MPHTSVNFVIVDVFTRTPFGGNQLAVITDARGLSAAAMQTLAREFNFAETSFVLPPSVRDADHRVRIFTPRQEVAFAGHPTVGTAVVLASTEPRRTQMVLEEGVGLIDITARVDDDVPFAELTMNARLDSDAPPPERSAVAAALSLDETAVIGARFASVGLPFCLIRLDSRDRVDAAVLDRHAWTAHFANAWSGNLFFYAGDPLAGGELYARMFAPALGIEEDPATGSACAALAACCANGDGRVATEASFTVAQGVKMGRASYISARGVAIGRELRVTIGGHCALVAKGTVTVPE